MAKYIGDPKKASYEANTLSIKTGPLHAKLISYFNETHEAVANTDMGTVDELRKIVPALLEEFERTECEKYENPAWLKFKMRAGWHVALGEFEKAYKFEHEGLLAAAGEPERRSNRETRTKRISISASNIADQLLRQGRALEALEWAKTSVDLWPTNTVNHLVYGQVLYHAGMKKHANGILDELRRVAQFGNSRDVLAKCMTYERALQDMFELPAVKQLLREMRLSIDNTNGCSREGEVL